MAKKRKAPRNSEPAGPREVDPKDARLTIRTYEDVADDQDEYWAKKDRIDFDESDDEPRSKRLRRQEKEDAFLEASDEEVLADDDSEEDESEEEEAPTKKQKGKFSKGKKVEFSEDEDEEGGDEEGQGDEGWWGSSKKDYYDADQIENEADALEEEAEAKRLQAKKLAKMQEDDFAFDEADWLNPKEKKTQEEQDVITEVLKEAEVTEDMGPEERYRMLQARYPEFDYLIDEFRELQPLLPTYQKEAEGKATKSLEVVRFWVLGCYIASLASYFAILTSPARDGDGTSKTISPAELRDHEVMEMLMSCREKWLKVKNLKSLKPSSSDLGMLSPPEDEEDVEMSDAPTAPVRKRGKKLSKTERRAKEEREAAKLAKAEAAAKSLADLSSLLKSSKKVAKADKVSAREADDEDAKSDFGEEDALDSRTANEKAQRKKSLKFYTSQIVQKASRRADAGRDAGGDADIPYRERFRDRQMRLNAEAERRGKKAQPGTELGGDDSDAEAEVAKQVRGEEDEYYDMVAHQAAKKKADKEERFKAIAAARKGERVVEEQTLGPDGKRQISYQIQKNKGLTPHRKKEVRNPRVKKKMQYEAKQKKLRSVKAVYKGGEGKGGYQGELSGINTRVVKSVKL
ncbi:Sas10 C-terminal domain containing protein [Naviculisporaceae sp. PSN 640]